MTLLQQDVSHLVVVRTDHKAPHLPDGAVKSIDMLAGKKLWFHPAERRRG